MPSDKKKKNTEVKPRFSEKDYRFDDEDYDDDDDLDDEEGVAAFFRNVDRRQMLVVAALFCVIMLGILLAVSFIGGLNTASANNESKTTPTPLPDSAGVTSAASEPTKRPSRANRTNLASLDVTIIPGYEIPDDSIGSYTGPGSTYDPSGGTTWSYTPTPTQSWWTAPTATPTAGGWTYNTPTPTSSWTWPTATPAVTAPVAELTPEPTEGAEPTTPPEEQPVEPTQPAGEPTEEVPAPPTEAPVEPPTVPVDEPPVVDVPTDPGTE